VTQLFTYLLMQCHTAATLTSVCLLLRMTQQDVHADCQQLPKIWVGTFLMGRDFELILMVKMETRQYIP